MGEFFDYFQLLALTGFLFLILGVTVYLRRKIGVNAITLSLKNKGFQGILEVTLFALVNVWILEILLYSIDFGFRLFPKALDFVIVDFLPVKISGVITIVAGFIVFALALNALGYSWRLGIDERNPGELITRGIYSVSRNPIYIFFGLYFIGAFLINGTLVFLVFALLTIINLHYQIREEEKFLERIHKQKYVSYRLVTHRYLTLWKVCGGAMRRVIID